MGADGCGGCGWVGAEKEQRSVGVRGGCGGDKKNVLLVCNDEAKGGTMASRMVSHTKAQRGLRLTKSLIEISPFSSGSRRTRGSATEGDEAPRDGYADCDEVDLIRQRVGLDYSARRHQYATADVLVVEDDPTSRLLLCNFLSLITVRSNDPNDEGRKLQCVPCVDGNEAIRRIQQNGETYAFITVDNLLGPDSPCGREVVRTLRECGYSGAMVYVMSASSTLDIEFENHMLEVGADAMLIKGTRSSKDELKVLVGELVTRHKWKGRRDDSTKED